ncbi:MAG: murein hydrolase activator EnvC family protein [Myxococcota bacterium]
MLALPLSGRATDGDERLREIRSKIEAREARARSYEQEADSYLEELEAIDRELVELRRSQRQLRRRQRLAEEELELASEGLAEAAQARERTRRALEVRLVVLYKHGATGGLPLLYSAEDFQSFARRREGLERVLEQDTELFARYRLASAAWQRSRQERRRLLDEIATSRRELERRRERVREESVARRNLVALLRSRSEQEERAAAELRQAAARLEQALARMPGGAALPESEPLRPGGLSWPALGPIRLGFGRQLDPEFGTLTRRSGIEIEAVRGTPVRAVAPGRVLFAGWFRGYGQLIIVDHGHDTVTVSGYLEEIAVEKGALVQRGQRIGTVGETGSLLGPGLYFEIRREGTPVDPVAWLGPS